MLTLYVVRHGTTSFNEKGRLQGQIDSPLTKKGVAEAKASGKKLCGALLDEIYASDLRRTRRTAELIRKTMRFRKRVITVKALREINFGKAAGLSIEEAKRQYPLYKKKAAFVFPDGESYAQVQRRVMHFVHSVEKKHSSQTILFVTHAGCIRGILCSLQRKSLEKNLRMPISHRFIARMILNRGKLMQYEQVRG
jgi:broad specificity phosphatase PhoE